MDFEWDETKNSSNISKHGISFYQAQQAFADPQRIIAEDVKHSTAREKRYYCFGQYGGGIVTVRFTYRDTHIRIIGAGYWRKGAKIYEQENG